MKLRTFQAVLLVALSFAAQQAAAGIIEYATPYKIVGKQSGLCLTGYAASGLPAPVGNGLKFHLQPCANDINGRSMQTFYLFTNWSATSVVPQWGSPNEVRIFSAKEFEATGQWSPLQAARAWAAPIYMGGNNQYPSPEATWVLQRGAPSNLYSAFEVTIKHYPTGYCISPAYHSSAPGTTVAIGQCDDGDVWRLVPTNYATSPVF